MSTPEIHAAAVKPGRRFQFSLRAMFGLTTGTAAFFALGRMLGYVDAVVILAAILAVVGIMEYPRRVHLVTGILLTLVAGTLLWANLRPRRWVKEFNVSPPHQLDPVAKSMFFRGWPLTPFLFSPYSHMQFEPSDVAVHLIVVFDGVVFAVALFVARGVSEFCLRRRAKRAIKTLPDPYPQSPSPPAGSTSGRLVK